MFTPSFDVGIVGAGPAGLAAASRLVGAGARVLIVERHGEPGFKACGGGVTSKGWPFLYTDSNAVAYRRLNVHYFGRQTVITTPGAYMRIWNRPKFVRAALDRLVDAGVTLVTDRVRGVGLVGRGVALETTTHGRFFVGRLVGADGAKSVVRRLLALPSAAGLCCLQWQLDGRHPVNKPFGQCPGVWFDRQLFGTGYGWVFPDGDTLRAGVGIVPGDRQNRHLRQSLLAWSGQCGFSLEGARLEGGSIGCRFTGYRFGPVWLAGDAAGLASPLTGEGIGAAFVSGDEVAKEILDSGYRSKVIGQLATAHRRTNALVSHPFVGPISFFLGLPMLGIGSLGWRVLARFS